MQLNFTKYHGTGNDFIIINNMDGDIDISSIEHTFEGICHRRFGIGADGLIFLCPHDTADFTMVYYNSDGKKSSMCGNGGRCIVHFAKSLGVIKDHCTFEAIDGMHEASISDNIVSLKMSNVAEITNFEHDYILDTGSPHYVSFKENVEHLNVKRAGFQIRHSSPFAEKGINVNFVHEENGGLLVRTYERGVEDETYSCGTGVVAASLAFAHKSRSKHQAVKIRTLGGSLQVTFEKTGDQYENIRLIGPAVKSFEGRVETNDFNV